MHRALTVVALLASCGLPDPQEVWGRIDLTTFPSRPSYVEAFHLDRGIGRGKVATDGYFTFLMPTARSAHIEALLPDARIRLTFPRKGGGFGSAVYVASVIEPLDIGLVRNIGDPTLRTYSFEEGCVDGAMGGALCIDDDFDADNYHSTAESTAAPPCAPVTDQALVKDDDHLSLTAAVVTHNLPMVIGCIPEESL